MLPLATESPTLEMEGASLVIVFKTGTELRLPVEEAVALARCILEMAAPYVAGVREQVVR